jgi:hypothetical protein
MTAGNHLLSGRQLAALQAVAITGMQTPVIIQRRVTSDTIYGDDDEMTFVTVTTALAWFHSTPTPVQEQDTGSIVTANTYRLYVPVGTDIDDGDQVLVGSAVYVVSDTTKESTWKALLACSLRKRE